MAQLAFQKYEGLGNDFVIVEVDDEHSFEPALARRLCDRHWGVGGDGVLLVSTTSDGIARARMTVLNADGSRPEMCGNGLRCVALHLAHQDGQGHARFTIETDAGHKTCEVVTAPGSPDVQGEVTLSMGRPTLGPPLMIEHDGKSYPFDRVSMGNPHAIIFGAIPPLDLIDRLGALVSGSEPSGSNVEFAELQGKGLRLIVWERGVGRTLACGTGACATVAAAVHRRLLPHDEWVAVELPGGALQVLSDGHGECWLRGPARRVFQGSVEL